VLLDGGFIRLNTFKNHNEKRTVISAHLMAGAPLSIADQYNTIGEDVGFYQNSEVLFLNADKFVGKPLSNNPTDERSEIWTGQMSNGNWIIGMFNRSETTRTRTIAFSTLGITEPINVRDLWQYGHLGKMKELTADIPPHGCLMVKLATTPITCPTMNLTFDSIPNKIPTASDFTPIATSNIGQPIDFEIASGPATIVNNKVHLTGVIGTVYVIAKQQITTNHCAALPQVRSFKVVLPNAVQNAPNEPIITLFPNPIHTILTVNCTELMDNIHLMDITGRKVLSKSVHANSTSLDVGHLPKGMYCLQVFRGDRLFVKKVFIE
jgi:Alpha galactosidase C-terminal beta sandwich domain/Secretion system C-terminal sorting domain